MSLSQRRLALHRHIQGLSHGLSRLIRPQQITTHNSGERHLLMPPEQVLAGSFGLRQA
jgi:hypothetical protein